MSINLNLFKRNESEKEVGEIFDKQKIRFSYYSKSLNNGIKVTSMNQLANFLEYILYNKHSKNKDYKNIDRNKVVEEINKKIDFKNLVEAKGSLHIAGKDPQKKLERLRQVYNKIKEDMKQLGDQSVNSMYTFNSLCETIDSILAENNVLNDKTINHIVNSYEAALRVMNETYQTSLAGISFEKLIPYLKDSLSKVPDAGVSATSSVLQNILSNLYKRNTGAPTSVLRTGNLTESHSIQIEGGSQNFYEIFENALNANEESKYWDFTDTVLGGKTSIKKNKWNKITGKGRVQMTSDITIEFPNEFNNLGLTLKNYTEDNIHFRNYALVQYLQNNIFLNIFINMYFRYLFWVPYKDENRSTYKKSEQDILSELKRGIIMTAIFGSYLNNQSQILIANIRSKQKVYVVSAAQLAKAIKEKTEFNGIDLPKEALTYAGYRQSRKISASSGLATLLATKVPVQLSLQRLFEKDNKDKT